MTARIEVIEGVEDDIKCLKPCNVELGVFDVVVVGFNLDVGVELMRRLFGNLLRHQRTLYHLTKALEFHIPMLSTS